MALYQALQSKSSALQYFTRPSSSNAKSGTSTPLVSVRAASGEVRFPIINVATAGTKDVRRQVPSTSTAFTTATAAPSASHSNSRWEQELADGVIDLGGLELSQERRAEVVEAVRAGAERGVFYITNFGVELELLDQIRAATADFFALPAEEKAKVASATAWETEATDRRQGYLRRFSAQGDHMPSFRETFRFTSHPEALKHVLQWSPLAQEFRDTFFKYQERVAQSMHFINGLLAEGLGLPASYIADRYGDTVVTALFTRTPPLTARPDSDEKPVPGLTPHYDSNFFNINVAGCGGAASRGLQFFEAGQWHNMPVFRDAALVNIGEDWETVSNGKYHSGLHRVLRNSEATARMSFLTTVETQPDRVLAPAAELIHPHTATPAKYRPRRRAERTARLVETYNGHTLPQRSKTDLVFDADMHLDKARDIVLVGGQEFLAGKPLGTHNF